MFKISSLIGYSIFGSAMGAGQCPFGFDSDKRELSEDSKRVLQEANYPSELFVCPSDKVKV